MRSKRSIFHLENSLFSKSAVLEIMKKQQWFPSNSPHGFTKNALEKSLKNGYLLLSIELVFESTKIAKSLNMLCFISFFTSSIVNIGGSQRGLKRLFFIVFLSKNREEPTRNSKKRHICENHIFPTFFQRYAIEYADPMKKILKISKYQEQKLGASQFLLKLLLFHSNLHISLLYIKPTK